jgi:L-lactate dehydrogenase complex protein LldG
MAEGRDSILDRVRGAIGRPDPPDRGADGLLGPARPRIYARPGFSGDPLDRFAEKVTAAAGTLVRIETADGVPAAVAAYLGERNLPARMAIAPALRDLPWPESWEVRFGASAGGDRVAVTPCFLAVAETGTLVLLSGPETPTTLNFLPDHHLVVVRASQVVGYLESVWEWLRGLPNDVPRTVNLITGPSRTADVEQTLQLGAHGPLGLHVILQMHGG